MLCSVQLLYEEVLSHSSPLETIATKGSNMTEHTATQQEIQKLSERYTAIKDKAKVSQGCQTVGSRPVLTFVWVVKKNYSAQNKMIKPTYGVQQWSPAEREMDF